MVTTKTIQQLFNQALNTIEFPGNLKNVVFTHVCKKESPLNKNYYWPVRGVSIISIVFGKLMQNQVNLHISFFCRHISVVTERDLIVNML